MYAPHIDVGHLLNQLLEVYCHISSIYQMKTRLKPSSLSYLRELDDPQQLVFLMLWVAYLHFHHTQPLARLVPVFPAPLFTCWERKFDSLPWVPYLLWLVGAVCKVGLPDP